MLERAKRASHIDPPASSYAIMRRARPYRGENPVPGKDVRGELAPTPGIREQPNSRRSAGPNVPAGTLALVRSLLVLRCSREQNALHTLIHQRHLTPSCGGHAPTAERTLYPARMFAESLTPRPELENDQDPYRTSGSSERRTARAAVAVPQLRALRVLAGPVHPLRLGREIEVCDA